MGKTILTNARFAIVNPQNCVHTKV